MKCLYLHSAKVRIAERMAYRGEYFISLLAMFVLELVGPLFIYVIYSQTDGFPGWTFHELLLVQGLLLLVKGISSVSFFGIVWNTNFLLKKGEFDRILLKPRNPLYMLICESFDSEDIGKIIGGIVISIYAFSGIGQVTLPGFMLMLALMLLGIGFYFALAVISSSIVFMFIQTFRIYEILDLVELLGRYPSTIFPKTAGTIFTALFPVFIIAVFPVRALLGEFSWGMLMASIAVVALIMISLCIWFRAIKKYSSAGG